MRIPAIASLAVLAACYIRAGQHVEKFEPAHRAEGTTAVLTSAAASATGELLEVRDTALIVRADNRVTLVPLRVLTSATFVDMRRRSENAALSPEELQQLRALSRYPYGMSDAVLAKMLTGLGQTSIAVVAR